VRFKISDFKVLDVRPSQKREVIDYGVEMVGAPLEWGETTGKGIKVGIIDTGIDINHQDLKGRVKDYVNFSFSDRKDILDENGHGTHVAGIIAAERNNVGIIGVAPEADLYIAKAFNKDCRCNKYVLFFSNLFTGISKSYSASLRERNHFSMCSRE
jgi:subtilisin